MSKQGRRFEGLKRSSKNRQSNDSLREADATTISGGMGERKTTSEESRQGFADDELESISFTLPRNHKSSVNKCNRCQNELTTKARYCRRCYETREEWMPQRPTRRKRRRPRERNEERPVVRSLDRRMDTDQLFNPLATLQKGPKGEGLLLPGSKFSNLPQFALRRMSSLSSVSSAEFLKERRREWLKRRVYYKWRNAELEVQWGEVLSRCLVCKVRRCDAYVVHGNTAHGCVCQRCATALIYRQGRCPQCNTLATAITQKPQ